VPSNEVILRHKFAGRAPQIFGLAAFLIGLIDLITLTLPFTHGQVIKQLSGFPGIVRGPAILSTFFVSFCLILIADGLARRKYRAFLVTEFLLLIVMVNRILLFRQDAIGIAGMLIPFVFLIALSTSRSSFNAKPAPHTWRFVVVVVLLGGLIVFATSAMIVFNRMRELHQNWSWSTYVSDGIPGLVGSITSLTSADNATSDLVYFALSGLGLGLVVSLFYVILSSPKPDGLMEPAKISTLREVFYETQNRDSLSYFALREDKFVCWSPDGKACIVYRVEFGVMLASGDPLGDKEYWPAAMEAFVALAHSYGWLVGVISASADAAALWTQCESLLSLHIGDEAIIETRGFSLSGRHMKNVRNAVTRSKSRGYSVNVCRLSELSTIECAQLSTLSQAWRVGRIERGFSMALGRIDQMVDPDVVVARSFVNGEIYGFMTFVPWGDDGLSLDFMRRHKEATNGINELLLTELVEWSKANGIQRVSLNFATFRKLLEEGASQDAKTLTIIGRAILLFASRFVQIETLYRFNSKFDPIWQPRYLVFESRREFLRAGLSALAAEGFL
jgi:lysyl-tRNA synthetase class 2